MTNLRPKYINPTAVDIKARTPNNVISLSDEFQNNSVNDRNRFMIKSVIATTQLVSVLTISATNIITPFY
jgi:hypothetical protein